MNSWDVFDTLIARRVWDPHVIPAMAREMKIPELDLERSLCFPILENLRQVQPGDLLISDMHLPEEQIAALVREVTGLDNRVMVTPDGKASGRIWKQVNPQKHTGDNPLADIQRPCEAGIQAEHYTGTLWTASERMIAASGFMRLAWSMREGRLRTFDPDRRELELVQTQINFPLLYLAAVALRPQLAGKRVLASSRDCYLWQHLLRQVTGADVVYWWTSRLARAFPTPEYLAYTENLMDDSTILVDLIGSGWSLRRIAERLRRPPAAMWMLAYCGDAMNEHYESLRGTRGEVRSLIRAASQGVEHHNVAPHSMVTTFAQGQPVFWDPTGFDWVGSPEIATSHHAFHAARLAIDNYPEEKTERKVKPELLTGLMQRLPEAPWIPREDRHVQEELRSLADAENGNHL